MMGIMEHTSSGNNAIARRFQPVWFLLLGLMLLSSCGKDEPVIPVEPESPKDVILIRYGVHVTVTSMLEPCKYCIQETAATKNDIVYVEKGFDSLSYPARLKRVSITREEWDDLVHSMNIDSVAKVDSNQIRGINGMPVNEWIEVETGLMKKKVVFEYGAPVKHLDSIIVRMRALHARVQI